MTKTFAFTLLLFIAQASRKVHAFSAGQPAPWISQLNENPNLKLQDVYIIRRLSKRSSSAVSTSEIGVSKDNVEESDDEVINDTILSSDGNMTKMNGLIHSSNSNPQTSVRMNAVSTTVQSSLGPLWKMTRPGNFLGLLCFHALGLYRALSSKNIATTKNLIQLALQPSMLVTLLSLMLVCSTSMIVNDYYDAKSGLDSHKISGPVSDSLPAVQGHHTNHKTNNEHYKPLVSGEVTYPVTKRFLSYLYTALLVSATTLPGVTSRLSVIVASMVTFWYTQHLKPKTWLKNAACATLISLAPLTSGSAALHLLSNGSLSTSQGLRMTWLHFGRLTLALFSGVMAREIMMDIGDYEADKISNVTTVPVRYGRRFAGGAALGCVVISSIFTLSGPLFQLLTSETTMGSLLFNGGRKGVSMISAAWKIPALRRLTFAISATVWLIIRAYQVKESEGEDSGTLDRAIEDSKKCVLLVLASFL